MKQWWWLLLVTQVTAQGVRVGPVPGWVKEYPVHIDEALALRDMEDGYVHFLADRQFNIATASTYHRNVLCLETEAGVQNASQVSVGFDPSYEQVVFHYIRIIRGAKVIDALKPGGFKILHQEKDIYKSIYNGGLTAMLFLKDVRKGDRVDFAYSVNGNNPVFQDKFSETLDAGYSVPVTHLRYRVVCPEGRDLRVRKSESVLPDPQMSKVPGARVYTWNLDNVPAYDDEDDAPSWYDPYPSIQLSEFQSWKEVNDWALSLFQTDGKVSGALAKKIRSIRETCPTKEAEVLAALRFVQDEVRYLGIEMGPNTHQPHDPGQVVDQRFGDCKDKTLLLCTMLRNLGIPADPVLINTDDKSRLLRELPSTDDFDHATVRVWLDGKYYWLDPTISFQRGRLRDIAYPDYQCGLVLTDTTTALTVIPLQDKGMVSCHELFWIDSVSGSARMDVTTRYSGSFADDARGDFNTSSRGEIQKNYLDFYADSYEGIRVRDSIGVVDTAVDGSFVTHEYYTVPKLWTRDAGGPKASFDASLIRSILPKLKDKNRNEPFALSFPDHYVETLEVRLPEDYDLASRNKVVEDPGFIFHTSVKSFGHTVRLTYTYETRKDFIQAGDSRSAYRHLDKVRDELGYALGAGWEEDEEGGSHPMRYLWVGILIGVLGTTVVFLLVRRRPAK
ncbi:DUF3857 domain-containing transglutaminase family protein [Dinghuibacter silviterrae]|uniref:Transglutaminase superfamily protein n=1 Tax=Dinghuibacter silviterrae TaxID=1539049 RepID=A0A4R8DMJ0_9BACT|nr:DUF3857 domain-containing transglutaminase family protein [Dinghuibacter silviterrae]TDW99211.1 transglutaminase superfamily protein [Dinghuibacter silviterrae]